MIKILVVLACSIATIKGDGFRIGGGDLAENREFPFVASLVTNGGTDGRFEHACGGTIISSSAILTAGSCFYTGTLLDPVAWWRARVGSSYSNTGGVIYLLRLRTVHPDFVLSTLENDIAVVRTTLALHLQPGVVEAAFITGAATTLSTFQPVEALGWGITNEADPYYSQQLRHVQFWVTDQQVCTNRYDAIGVEITDNMVCANFLDVTVHAQCQGDNGGPLLSSRGVVSGVFSRAAACDQHWFPGVNTRVAPYTRWIVETATFNETST